MVKQEQEVEEVQVQEDTPAQVGAEVGPEEAALVVLQQPY